MSYKKVTIYNYRVLLLPAVRGFPNRYWSWSN